MNAPRIGIVSCNSLNPHIHDTVFQDGINLSEAERYEAASDELVAEGHAVGSDEHEAGMQDYADRCDDSDGDTYLIGSWKRDSDGLYVVDRAGDFAAIVNYHSNIVAVEYSRYTVNARGTSPCYRQADDGGPCGDLDSLDDSGEATYTLPPYFFDAE